MQRQLLPHAHAYSRWILAEEARRSSISHDSVSMETEVAEEQVAILDAIHRLWGSLCRSRQSGRGRRYTSA
jgi:hypothetical protein